MLGSCLGSWREEGFVYEMGFSSILDRILVSLGTKLPRTIVSSCLGGGIRQAYLDSGDMTVLG